MNTRKNFMLALALLMFPFCAIAQDAVEDELLDELGRDSPRGAVVGFMNAIAAEDAELAGQYLDVRNLPQAYSDIGSEELALGLFIILERATWIDLLSFSQDADGYDNDGLPSYRDELAVVDLAGEELQLYLQRVPGENGTRVWKVSNASVARLLELYDQYRYSPQVEWLFNNVPPVNFLGVALFKWVATIAVGLVAAPFVLSIAYVLTRLLLNRERPIYKVVKRFLMGPISYLIVLLIMRDYISDLGMGLVGNEKQFTGQIVLIAALIWVMWSAVDLIRARYAIYLTAQGKVSSVALLGPIATATKSILVLLGVLQWMDNLGYEITAILAGLGVGGIAVALVLQKPLEDIFGAITLYMQQPIKIGDFGRFGDATGFVEEISLRTTRIRTLDNTVLAVPNMRLASEPIENYSAREKILYSPTIRLTHETRHAEIKEVLKKMRELLADDELVLEEGARVRFTAIGEEAYELQIFAYIDVQDHPSYLEAAERLNFGVMELLEELDVSLAKPMPDVLRM